MNVVRKGVTIVNPGQIPVIACDQPLFKITKQIQWMWPEEYGEESFVIMLGGLHIKMALLKVLGDLLDGSGWTSALVQAEIATAGTSNSFLKVVHVKKPLLLTRLQLVLCTSFGRHHMLTGKHVSWNVMPHRLMNGANREQLKVHSSISGNLCSAPSWTHWPGTDQSFCMWRLCQDFSGCSIPLSTTTTHMPLLFICATWLFLDTNILEYLQNFARENSHLTRHSKHFLGWLWMKEMSRTMPA